MHLHPVKRIILTINILVLGNLADWNQVQQINEISLHGEIWAYSQDPTILAQDNNIKLSQLILRIHNN